MICPMNSAIRMTSSKELYAQVTVDITAKAVDRTFTYRVPPEILAGVGFRVIVPFGAGNKTREGVIVSLSSETDVPPDKIKDILSSLDNSPALSERTLALAHWMREKYYCTLAEVIGCILPAGIDMRNQETAMLKQARFVYINEETNNIIIDGIIKAGGAQGRVLALLRELGKLTISEVKTKLDCSLSPISTLEKKGIVTVTIETIDRDTAKKSHIGLNAPTHVLNVEQSEALKRCMEIIALPKGDARKKPILIHGVTGSGKTEVYMRVIESVVRTGQDAIVLVPEIALTPQAVSLFISRFGSSVAVTHSRLSAAERLEEWRKAKDGKARIMIGPRSALFTPFENLGVIIIDEEHEHTYQSDQNPKYDARAVAEKICEITGAALILGSATPSIETYFKAERAEYEIVKLKYRVNNTPPEVAVVDMRLELASGNRSIFCNALTDGLRETLARGEQAILFLNRRGYATFVSCRTCGGVMTCDACSVNLTYHMYNNSLVCHYCGHCETVPQVCPICGSKHIKFFGTGTQKIEDEIRVRFPQARVLRMDMDTTSKKNGHARIIKQFANKQADILIGTQMIAKGHDFPSVTLVGIIAADLSLNTGDFRAAERSFQLITQVSGRAGRADAPGRVIVQTYDPEHYAIVFASQNDYENFYEHEITIRNQMQYPPYTNFFSIMLVGEHEKEIIIALNKLADLMKSDNPDGLELLGPAPAVVSKVKNNFRWRLLIKGVDEDILKNFALSRMDTFRAKNGLPTNISALLALNPRSLL